MPASVRGNTRVTTVDEGLDVYTKKVMTIKKNNNKKTTIKTNKDKE